MRIARHGGRPGALKLSLVAAAALPFLAGCSGGAKGAGASAQGRELFLSRCSVCHGQDGEGRQVGAMRTQSLKSDSALKMTDERMAEWIKRGSSGMPSFASSLTDEQIGEVVRFVRADIQGR